MPLPRQAGRFIGDDRPDLSLRKPDTGGCGPDFNDALQVNDTIDIAHVGKR